MLPSTKSQLKFNADTNKLSLKHRLPEGSNSWQPLHIYITAPVAINEPCWCITFPFKTEVFKATEVLDEGSVRRAPLVLYPIDWCKRIVMTTDPVLIKDGIQEIDKDFLETYALNPMDNIDVSITTYQSLVHEWWHYSLSEQESSDLKREYGIYGHDQGTSESEVFDMYMDKHGLDKSNFTRTTLAYELVIPQEHTVIDDDSAAEQWVFGTSGNEWSNNDNTAGDNYGSFKAGAKWKATQMHSNDEVLHILNEYCNEHLIKIWDFGDIEWFEEFKK